jgi:putative nucleotidyltransferase with HDIG domain
MRALRTLVIEVGAEKMFVSRDKRIAAEAQKVWKHSLAVALVARDLRSFTGQSDHEEAYLAGLLHDIGKPIVAGMLLAAEKQLAEGYSGRWIGSELWAKVLHGTHRKVGVALAQKWQLPETVCGAIHGSSEFDPGNRASLSNTVCFANAVAKTCGISTRDDKDEAGALLMIGKSVLGLDDELIQKLVKSLESRMAA